MPQLSINLNKIALIRNSREGSYPSVTRHAQLCIDAGADGITVHPRPDQRHIRVDDCFDLADMLSVEFNIEGNPFAQEMASKQRGVGDYPGFLEIVSQIRPAQCTLVPDSSDQLTSDHGFDLQRDGNRLRPVIKRLQALGIRVSLFMDPVAAQIRLAQDIGADRIEFYTGPYAAACNTGAQPGQAVLARYREAAILAADLGLGINAGHDLNLHDLRQFAQNVPALLEVSIGHAFTVDCLELGLPQAVLAYQRCLQP